jgi:peptidoglycan-associated lipoprotein
MIKRLLPLFAASLLLAACETASTVSGDGASEVQSSSTTAAASSSSTAVTEAATEAPSARTIAENQLASVGNTVLFGFDSASLTDAAQATLNRQAAFMQASPTLRVVIGGHADERGTREYNLALGERRAAATRDYLVAKGVNAARVRIISYGKERPVAVGSNDVSWAKNRRAVTALN